MEADRMMILLKRKEEQLKGAEMKELDVHFVTKQHADHKQRQVVALMLVLSKEDAPLNELPCMVPNDRYIGEHSHYVRWPNSGQSLPTEHYHLCAS
jgi:hypothetical protein